MKDLKIRYQRVSDAKRFLEILSHPDFIYFPAKPRNIKEEKAFLTQNKVKHKNGTEHNFSVIYGGELVGAVGISIDQKRKYVGEIGYFVAQEYWDKGIATKLVKLIEKFAFDKLEVKRIEVLIRKENKASQRVVEKNGYIKEGIQKSKLKFGNKYFDAYIFAKIR